MGTKIFFALALIALLFGVMPTVAPLADNGIGVESIADDAPVPFAAEPDALGPDLILYAQTILKLPNEREGHAKPDGWLATILWRPPRVSA